MPEDGERVDPAVVVIARMHYEHRMTHQEIADQLGLTRVKVTRTLAQARELGVVEITIRGDAEPFAELAVDLGARFGLDGVWISPSFARPDRAAESLAVTGGAALTRVLADASLVAVGLSSVLAAVVHHLTRTPVTPPERPISFVPMAGGWGGWLQWPNPAELPARLTAVFGGRALAFPAPLLATDAELAGRIAAMPEVREALATAAAADTAVFGVGGLNWATYALRSSMTDAERVAVTARHAVGDTSARFFDAVGEPVDSTMDRRVIGLTLAQMRAIPRRLVVASGPHKLVALRATLATGLATHLCTDHDTAVALLADR
ncbi:sugar-binding transcriptional regulator [Propionicicella superfundia]|uniref:sugar-binding transcriptional regulator n=1 Tax=Propionicicella superfundia TaxID=348582 RepID=UPI0004030441|nr:sugar-binding domain-containing protein [Propionicicella superfundia]